MRNQHNVVEHSVSHCGAVVQYSSLPLGGEQFFVHCTPCYHVVLGHIHTQCHIFNTCNIFHFYHSASVENANPIFPQFFSFCQLDIPVSQNHIFLACIFSTLYLSIDFTQRGVLCLIRQVFFTEKHILVLTQYRRSGYMKFIQ